MVESQYKKHACFTIEVTVSINNIVVSYIKLMERKMSLELLMKEIEVIGNLHFLGKWFIITCFFSWNFMWTLTQRTILIQCLKTFFRQHVFLNSVHARLIIFSICASKFFLFIIYSEMEVMNRNEKCRPGFVGECSSHCKCYICLLVTS